MSNCSRPDRPSRSLLLSEVGGYFRFAQERILSPEKKNPALRAGFGNWVYLVISEAGNQRTCRMLRVLSIILGHFRSRGDFFGYQPAHPQQSSRCLLLCCWCASK